MATPSRTTRARSKTPSALPAIPAKQSHAYGGEGKSNLKSQVRSTATDFGNEFQTSRQEPPQESDEEPAPSPAKKLGGRRGKGASRPAPIVEEPEERSPSPAPTESVVEEQTTVANGSAVGRSGTALDAGAGYDAAANRRPDAEMHVHNHSHIAYHPSRIRVFRRTLPRYVAALAQSTNPLVKDLVLLFAGLLVFLALLSAVPMPSSLRPAHERFFSGLKTSFKIAPYDRTPYQLEEGWFRFMQNSTISDLWNETEELKEDVKLMKDSIAALEKIIPSQVVVRKENGQYQIPDDFWLALEARLSDHGALAPRWRAWLDRNDETVRAMLTEAASEEVNNRWTLERKTFIHEMEGQIRNIWQNNVPRIRQFAAQAVTEALENSPALLFLKEEGANMKRAVLVQNAVEELDGLNWFTAGMGARIDPHLTSPTQKPPSKSWLEAAYKRLSPLVLKPHPPQEALRRWAENTDCWCAASAKNGFAQIAILIPEKVFPEQIIIEHITPKATKNIAAAPREFELWAEAPSAKEAKAVANVISGHYGQHKSCSTGPAPNYVCLGAWEYDIHGTNFVQMFNTWISTEEMGLGARKFVVRVLSNWGAGWTCLYRLRLNGRQVNEDPTPKPIGFY